MKGSRELEWVASIFLTHFLPLIEAHQVITSCIVSVSFLRVRETLQTRKSEFELHRLGIKIIIIRWDVKTVIAVVSQKLFSAFFPHRKTIKRERKVERVLEAIDSG